MNVFYVDSDPRQAARDLFDKHIVKMPLESAQIAAVVDAEGGWDGLPKADYRVNYFLPREFYKITHANHPSTRWTAGQIANYAWLVAHGLELCEEYSRRYSTKRNLNKRHGSEWALIVAQYRILDITGAATLDELFQGHSQPALAMPDEYKADCPVESYRNYYLGAKRGIAVWKHNNSPKWWI